MSRYLTVLVLFLTCGLASVHAADGIQLASVHAAVADLDSGEVLFTKRADRAVPIASVTKLMTAMVVLDARQPLDEWVEIVAWKTRTQKNRYSRLRVGSKARRGDLLRLAVMSSENRASYVLAQHYPGGEEAFVEAMNRKARKLGMKQTHFADPTGLSPDNRSTASDLLALVQGSFEYEKIREYTSNYQYTARFRNPSYTLGFGNTNPLTASSRWDVLLSKTCYLTEAGRCLVMVATVDDRRVAMVLLNSFGTRTPLGDAARVRRWLQTGTSGSVARAARTYERQVAAELEATSQQTAP